MKLVSNQQTLQLLAGICIVHALLIPFSANAADEEAAVRSVFDKLQSTWNAGDMDGYLSAYASTAPMTLTFGNQQVIGRAALSKLFRSSYPDPERMGRFTIDTLTIDFLDEDTAIGFGGFTHHFPHETVHGGFSHVLVKEDEGWVIRHERTSRASVEHHD